MPELPEVESVRRSLERALLGRRVERVMVRRPDVVEPPPASRRHRATREELLEGATLTGFERRGKHLALLTADGRALAAHLGMSGSLVVEPIGPGRHQAHTHVVWTLEGGRRLVFRDPRRFGGLWCFGSFEDLRRCRWTDLGPDALHVRTTTLAAAFAASRRAAKAVLLDQHAIAGVGNIYADESLFAAGVHPLRPAASLGGTELGALAAAVRSVLAAAVEAGGSTIRDYVGADGSPGRAQRSHAVYGRAGLPCVRCHTPLSSSQVVQRTTVWCPRCQK